MTFKHLRIGTQLALSFGLVAILLVIVVCLTFARIKSLDSNIELTNNTLYPNTVLAHRIKDKVNEAVIDMRNALLLTDPARVKDALDDIETGAKDIVAAIDEIDRSAKTRESRQYVDSLTAARGSFVTARKHFAELASSDHKPEATTSLFSEVLPAQMAYFAALENMIAFQNQRMTETGKQSSDDARQTEQLILEIMLAALIASALVAWYTTRSISAPLSRAVTIARTVADGDLTSKIATDSSNETGQLLRALHDMNGSLVGIVSQVRSGTHTIATASSEIAAGNLDLSGRTEQQASSLEETASAMEQLTSAVKQNADNAQEANRLATAASGIAIKGGNVVREVVDTMNSISASSKKIVDIISVIDSIAFQTNILALNAAVEAARAGEQGRGFAVVASEVRGLAQRSATAAKEIKTLIGDSVDKVSSGTALVEQAGATMNEVVASVKRVTDIVSEITVASNEQRTGIEAVNRAITEMDQVTQQNAALVEQAAGAASSMQSETQTLSQAVSVFKIPGLAATATPIATRVVASIATGTAQLQLR